MQLKATVDQLWLLLSLAHNFTIVTCSAVSSFSRCRWMKMNSSTIVRITMASVANPASTNRLFWKLPIILPKSFVLLGVLQCLFQHPIHRQAAMIAIEIRSCCRFCIR